MDDLHDVIASLSIKSKNFIDEAAKSLTPTMVGFRSEPQRNQNCTYFMQNTCQIYPKISKSNTKIENIGKFDEDFWMHKEPEIKVECSVNDPNKEVQVLLKKDLLKRKYMEALKLDENLEARVKQSAIESNPDMEEQQAELRKLHKDQVEMYKGVQEEIMVCFKRDMDDLIQQYEAEYTRLSKVHSKWLNSENVPTNNSNTHKP
ncbi:uncharacterized protein LOC6607345 [Drosophila sechellia]|uniref:GM23686 n=1 Tax=Drosophila sechellia TaxID=7238 RepID=B4HM56_DROSE|nr:uncharacterized protein LOC6607345 [Drosophila sechellia]EDW43104.1 GM23686 [Drosophila sechellia]